VCPRGGGKERKRLYEEGLTAGAVTAATVVAMEEERGTLSATRVYYYYHCFCCYCRESGQWGCRKSEREGGMFPVLEDGGIVGIYLPPPSPPPPPLHPRIVPPTDRLPGWTTTTTTTTTTSTTYYLSPSLRTPYQQQRSFSGPEYISPQRSSNSIPG